jgi:anti-anti-sigma regulatory factor
MQLTQQAGKARLEVDGPVRLGETAELHSLSLAAVETGLDVVLALGEAEHLHAAAIQVLRALERHLERHGRGFAVESASDRAAAALVLCGLSRWLNHAEEVA